MSPRDYISRLRFRRPHLQYGLKSLLIAMVAACLAFGWHVDRVHRQRRAVAALKQAGARVEYSISRYNHYDMHLEHVHRSEAIEIDEPGTVGEWLEWLTPGRLRARLGTDFFRHVEFIDLSDVKEMPSAVQHLRDLHGVRILHLGIGKALDDDLPAVGQLRDLTHLDANHSTVTDAGLVSIAPLCKLEYLNLWTNAITGTGLAPLAHLQKLEYLDLENNPIEDAGLAHLATLRRLTELNLSESKITGSGLCHLAGMADLENLDLGHTRLNDGHLGHVSKFSRLKHLSLDFTPVGDAGMKCLSGLPNLKSLGLRETMVTDDGLDSLRSLSGLEVLDLSSTAITDKGLRTLAALTSLKSLLIDDSAATAEGVAWLKRRLPKAETYFNEQGNAALNQVQVLQHAGLWQRALDTLGKLDAPYLASSRGLHDLGQCYAGLARWDDAERKYFQVLEQISQGPSMQWLSGVIWRELDAHPRLFERLAKARPNDAALRVALAQRSLVDSHWSAAVAQYARAATCPHTVDREVINRGGVEESVDFQYGLSRLLVGDVVEARRLRDRLIENNAYGSMFVAAHLQLWAPQGTDCPPEIDDWLRGSAYQGPSQALIDLRSEKFAEVEAKEEARQPTEGYGRYYWFAQAIAHHFLKHESDARECFARGRQWLERRTKKARIDRRYDWACELLEAEVLRREAERLIFN